MLKTKKNEAKAAKTTDHVERGEHDGDGVEMRLQQGFPVDADFDAVREELQERQQQMTPANQIRHGGQTRQHHLQTLRRYSETHRKHDHQHKFKPAATRHELRSSRGSHSLQRQQTIVLLRKRDQIRQI